MRLAPPGSVCPEPMVILPSGIGREAGPPNMRLLVTRSKLIGKGRSPCSEHPRATSIAAAESLAAR